jgi:hypothetical protein
LRPYDLGRVSKVGQDFPSLEGLGMLFLHTSSIVMPGFDASLSLNMVMINGVHGCMGHMMGMHLAIRYLAVSENFVYSKIATAMAILVVKGVKDRMWSCPHFWYGCGVWIDRVFQPFDPYLIFFSRNHRAPPSHTRSRTAMERQDRQVRLLACPLLDTAAEAPSTNSAEAFAATKAAAVQSVRGGAWQESLAALSRGGDDWSRRCGGEG